MTHISEIVIGDRVRKDMGDIKSLAESMKRHGLLHPVVVKQDGTLIAGHRRIEAAKLLGWQEIAVTTIEIEDLLSAERDENAERKDFTPTEAVEIGRQIEEQHRAKIAATRHDVVVRAGQMSAAKRLGNEGKILPPVAAQLGKTDEVAANAVGMAAPKYRQARAVVAAAEADPETFGDLPAKWMSPAMSAERTKKWSGVRASRIATPHSGRCITQNRIKKYSVRFGPWMASATYSRNCRSINSTRPRRRNGPAP